MRLESTWFSQVVVGSDCRRGNFGGPGGRPLGSQRRRPHPRGGHWPRRAGTRVSLRRPCSELAKENVEIAALCDCDENRLNQTADEVEKRSGKRPATFVDEAESSWTTSRSTPSAWPPPTTGTRLETIWACQAGKDVYVEKPASHNIFEGRKMVEAARKYNRIVQHGTQCRSSEKIREGIQKLKEGVIGRVYMAQRRRFQGPRGRPQPVRPGARGNALGPLAGPGPRGAVQPAGSRPLAVPQGIRQRRNRRPRGPPIGHHPLGARPGHASRRRCSRWAGTSSTRTTRTRLPTKSLPACTKTAICWCSSRHGSGTPTPRPGMGIEYPFVDHQNVVGVIFFGHGRLHDHPGLLELSTFSSDRIASPVPAPVCPATR